MSGAALVWATNIKGIKMPAKMVLIQLAERHNKDTGQCDPRISKLAEDCEMHRATVLRHLSYLEECGLLTRVKRGNENGGRASSQYHLHLGVKSHICDGVKSQGCDGGKVASVTGLSRTADVVKSQGCDPLYNDKPVLNLKEPKADDFDLFWAEVPRKVAKPKARAAFKAALKKKPAADIISAMRKYAASRRGEDEQFTAHPASWLNGERWDDDLKVPKSDPEAAAKINKWNKLAGRAQ